MTGTLSRSFEHQMLLELPVWFEGFKHLSNLVGGVIEFLLKVGKSLTFELF